MTTFGTVPLLGSTTLHFLENSKGVRAGITDYGATLVSLQVPDRQGRFADVVLGFDAASNYATHPSYFGSVIGRFANRIASGRFTLEGRTYELATNNSPGALPCHLHGGLRGFDKRIWQAEPLATADGPALRLSLRSPDGDEGYPGNLDVTVTYTLREDNALRLDYAAVTDRPTPLNLTNHSYFNLAGHDAGDVLGHILTLNASRYTPVNRGLIPTGAIAPVAGTPLDFRTPHPIGERIDLPDEQLRVAGGYDHNFVLDSTGDSLFAAATVLEPHSGRVLELATTEPGAQFYSGNFLAGAFSGKNGCAYPRRGGFCLETQHFPDSPNQPGFPSTILRPGQQFRSSTVFRFSTQ